MPPLVTVDARMPLAGRAAGILAVWCACCVAASEVPFAPGFDDRVFVDESGEHRYVVYVPEEEVPESGWPVVLYLHGAGGRGNDGRRQLGDGLAPLIRHKGGFPAVVVFPQCDDVDGPIFEAWRAESVNGRRALQMLNDVEQRDRVDPQRRTLAGWSMGGYGAWSLAAADPEHWSAVVALAGGGDPAQAAQLTTVPIWAIHGARDRAILPEQSRQMVDAVQRIGGHAEFTEVAGIGHDVWKYAFATEALTQWMLAPQTGPPPSERLQSEIANLLETGEVDSWLGPFEPALIVPRAVAVRIGRDALRTIAYGIPDAVRGDPHDGQLDDLHCEFEFEEDRFQIRMSGIGYEARLERVEVSTFDNGRVRLMIGVRPLLLRISETTIRGPRHSAAAGPITVRIGHLRPVWFDLTLFPRVVDHKLQLNLVTAQFQIPDENWHVQPPESVTAEGPGLTPELVRTGIVGGLYVRRTEIEREVRSVIPALVRSVEERIAPADGGRLARGIWPLPVFRPRLQFQLDDLSIDADGISLSLDVAAAAIDALRVPREPRVVSPIGPRACDVARSRDLQIAIAPGLLEPLGQLLVDAGTAHIDVRDLPDGQFAALADPVRVAELLPDLKRMGSGCEVRSELSLAAPFRIERAGRIANVSVADESSLRTRLYIPDVAFVLSVRNAAEQADWSAYAEFRVDLAQQAAVELLSPTYDQRALHFSWEGEPDVSVTGRFLDPDHVRDATIDVDGLAGIIRQGWGAWTEDARQSQVPFPDVKVGSATLRMESLDWNGELILGGFATPTTRLVNLGPRSLEYEVRGPFSPWSATERLAPGQACIYTASYALRFRRRDRREEPPLTLPLGSVSEFENGELKSP